MDLHLSLQSSKDLFTFPFQDPRWKEKFLIGSGLTLAASFIPVLPMLATLGYSARLARAGAANSDPTQLPEWDDWGDLLIDGLRQFGAFLLLMLPALVVFFAGQFFYLGSSFSMMAAENNMRYAGPAALVFFFGFFIFFLSMMVGIVLGLVSWVFIPVSQAHVAVRRSFSALFDVAAWWAVLRANWASFLLLLLLVVALYFLSILVVQVLYFSIVLCMFAPVAMSPLLFYTQVVLYRLAGQVYGSGEGEKAA